MQAATGNPFSAYHYYLSLCYCVPDIAKRTDIVCDRHIHSTLAYNWPYHSEIPEDLGGHYCGLKMPDMSFLLCASDSVRQERMLERQRKVGVLSALDGDFPGQERAMKIYMKFSEFIRVETDEMGLDDVVAFMAEKVKRA